VRNHNDHIWPRADRDPDKDYNKRRISARKNLQKGARMPNLNEVSDSSNPIRLATEIDKYSVTRGFRHRRNKNRGFGGLPHLRP